MSQGLQEGLGTVELAGSGFGDWDGRSLLLRLNDEKGAEAFSRKVGVMGSRLTASIGAHLLQPGRYRFTLSPVNDADRAVASGGFLIGRAGQKTPTAGAAAAAAESPRGVVGVWNATAGGVGTLELKADRTYIYGGRKAGRYRVDGDNVYFTGTLASWNHGRAALKDGSLEFSWSRPDGAKQWFSFARQ